jgi:hypothetical protein
MFTPVKLWYVTLRAPLAGQFIQAQTRGKSTYLIQTARKSPSHRGRWNLACVRWPPNEIPEGSIVLPLHWFKRERRRGARIRSA